MGNTCSAPGENGFVCEPTFLDFSMDSSGTALDDASARIESNPDIGGSGVSVLGGFYCCIPPQQFDTENLTNSLGLLRNCRGVHLFRRLGRRHSSL